MIVYGDVEWKRKYLVSRSSPGSCLGRLRETTGVASQESGASVENPTPYFPNISQMGYRWSYYSVNGGYSIVPVSFESKLYTSLLPQSALNDAA